jgi:hypothetical protein
MGAKKQTRASVDALCFSLMPPPTGNCERSERIPEIKINFYCNEPSLLERVDGRKKANTRKRGCFVFLFDASPNGDLRAKRANSI